MHLLRLTLFLVVPLLLALAGPLLMLWAWGNGLSLLPTLLVSIMFLAAAFIIFLVGQMAMPREQEEDIILLWHELENVRRQLAALQACLAGGNRQEGRAGLTATPGPEACSPAGQPLQPPARNGPETSMHPKTTTADGRAGAETAAFARAAFPASGEAPPSAIAAAASHPDTKGLSTSSATMASTTTMGPAGVSAAHSSVSSTSAPASSPASAFRLYMEPVMDLQKDQVRMYRAHPAMLAGENRIYLGRQAQLSARQRGRAGALQIHTLKRCIAFARQLQARGAALPIICPLDVTLLGVADVARQLKEMLRAQRAEDSAGILLALPMAELNESQREARRNILMLAQNVSGFVLDFSVLPAADAPLPLPLPVRHLDIPASALALGGKLSDWPEQRQRFHQRGMNLIASGVDTTKALERARKMVDLGRGVRLSPPRRVREEILEQEGAMQAGASSPDDPAMQAEAGLRGK